MDLGILFLQLFVGNDPKFTKIIKHLKETDLDFMIEILLSQIFSSRDDKPMEFKVLIRRMMSLDPGIKMAIIDKKTYHFSNKMHTKVSN